MELGHLWEFTEFNGMVKSTLDTSDMEDAVQVFIQSFSEKIPQYRLLLVSGFLQRLLPLAIRTRVLEREAARALVVVKMLADHGLVSSKHDAI
jgi:hypothetical protein